MRASRDLRAEFLAADKMSGGEQLFGGDDLVVASREQENRASHHREIDRASERRETARCQLIVFIELLHDLEIISAGEIDGVRVPFAKARDQRRPARHITSRLQQVMNGGGLERRMSPELQQMRAADASIADLYQLFGHGRRRAVGEAR